MESKRLPGVLDRGFTSAVGGGTFVREQSKRRPPSDGRSTTGEGKMKYLSIAGAAACAALALAVVASAAPVFVPGPSPVPPPADTVIDFEGQAEGALISTQYASSGVTFGQPDGGRPMIDNDPFLFFYTASSGNGVLTGSTEGGAPFPTVAAMTAT